MAKLLSYERWLERELNLEATNLAAYVRAAQESAPEGTGAMHSLLVRAWDGYQVLYNQDPRYQLDTDYPQQTDVADAPAVRYENYLEHLRELPANQHVLQQFVLTQLLARFRGEVDGAAIKELFSALFTAHEIDDGAAYEDYDTGEVTYPELTDREREVLTEVYGAEKLSALTAG